MTQRLVLTTQSKLTVQAPSLGSGVHPTPIGIPFGIAASAILSTGDYRATMRRPWRSGGGSHPCSLPRMRAWQGDVLFAT